MMTKQRTFNGNFNGGAKLSIMWTNC